MLSSHPVPVLCESFHGQRSRLAVGKRGHKNDLVYVQTAVRCTENPVIVYPALKECIAGGVSVRLSWLNQHDLHRPLDTRWRQSCAHTRGPRPSLQSTDDRILIHIRHGHRDIGLEFASERLRVRLVPPDRLRVAQKPRPDSKSPGPTHSVTKATSPARTGCPSTSSAPSSRTSVATPSTSPTRTLRPRVWLRARHAERSI